jgi:group I intron endonuclease
VPDTSQELLFILYLVTNRVTGKPYVGQTRDRLCNRWAKHCYAARRGNRGATALSAAIRKYGAAGFIVEELERCFDQETANEREGELIARYAAMAPDGYNLDPGGMAYARSAATRAKISAAHKGKAMPWLRVPCSPERAEKIRAAKVGKQPRGVGWQHSPETKEKMRIAYLKRLAEGRQMNRWAKETANA